MEVSALSPTKLCSRNWNQTSLFWKLEPGKPVLEIGARQACFKGSFVIEENVT